MQNIKLLFFLAVWKRPEITEICFMGLNRLKGLNRYPIEVLAVISEESMIPLCERYGVKWCFHENDYLGAKKNFGLQEALKMDFDFLIEIGSDDLIKNEYLDCIKFDRDVLVPAELALLNTEDGRSKRLTFRHARFGAGRAISRRAIEAVKGKLWKDDLSRGLDNYSIHILSKNGFFERRISWSSPLVIDLKSKDNIWSFDVFPGIECASDEVMAGLSKEETNAIKALQWQSAKS
jgi:hypothetical protein